MKISIAKIGLLSLALSLAGLFAQEGLKVKAVTGTVSYMKRGEPGQNTVTSGSVIPSDSQIQTTAGSHCEVVFPDGTVITVGPNTRFRVKNLSYGDAKDSGSFNIDYGKILAKFSKIGKSRDYQFITPTSVAGVRGTAFGLEAVQGGDARLLVTEGKVGFGSGDNIQEVGAGQIAAFGAAGFSIPPRAFTPDELGTMERGVPGGFSSLGAGAATPAPAATTPAPATTPTAPATTPGPSATPAVAPDAGTKPAPATTPAPSSKPEVKPDGAAASPAPSSTPAESGKPFAMGVAVGSVMLNGENLTRMALTPEIKLGKFGLGMDVELFIDKNGAISSRGWDFTTVESGVDSVLRKITYVSWSTKPDVTLGSDKLYFRVGKLDNVTMGLGYIMNGYNNSLNYPAEKNLGLDLTIGNLGGIKLGAELMVNNFADITRKGVVTGGRVFFSPFGASKGLFSGLRIGATYVADVNQFAGLKDSDGDGYPDVLDRFPTSNRYAADTDRDGIPDSLDIDSDGDNIPDFGTLSTAQKVSLSNTLASFGINNGVDFSVSNDSLQNVADKSDYFGMWGLDIILPFGKSFMLYGQMAMNHDISQDGVDTNAPSGWGFSAPGMMFSIPNFLDFNLEYRYQEGAFKSGYFNRNYDNQRARVSSSGLSLVTSDNTLSNRVTSMGVYGSMNLNLYVVKGIASYEQLWTTGTGFASGSLEARLKLNPDILKKIPALEKWIENIEAYYIKQKIDDLTKFFDPNETVTYGYELDLKLGGPIHVVNRYQAYYLYDSTGKLKLNEVFNVGMMTKF